MKTYRIEWMDTEMITTNSAEITLFCTSGIVQHAESAGAMLAEYNRNGSFYEIRTNDEGEQILWHKGHSRACGVFKNSE